MNLSIVRYERAYACVRDMLLRERGEKPYWNGKLSPSAVSTATATSALFLIDSVAHRERIERALGWLARTQNPDGGWGDTDKSRSNVSATALVLAAFKIAGNGYEDTIARAESFLQNAGGRPAVLARYGEDRTFSAPILANMAIAGLAEWDDCPRLPFWFAALPQVLFRWLRLRVVSYALPALISVGLARAINSRRDALGRIAAALVANRLLRVLERITPESGGYLEATPITAFVAMCLAAAGRRDHPVVRSNTKFLCSEQNEDGSWRIERDLSIWLTTLAVNALGAGDTATRDWLLAQQTAGVHPYVGSRPGAWGWTASTGSVPDADDTSGAVLALSILPDCARSRDAAFRGIDWLLGVQNSDGGFPTFCRGWQHLPFDRSCPDITAHALRALAAWRAFSAGRRARRIDRAIERGLKYLASSQGTGGSWIPLWFGNEKAPNEENPVLGTSRVLTAYGELRLAESCPARRGLEFLISAQNGDGSWGGARGVDGSIEETALACEALALMPGQAAIESLTRGLDWLSAKVEIGELARPAPIGLYFAKLWYYEELYPAVFAAGALRKGIARLASAS